MQSVQGTDRARSAELAALVAIAAEVSCTAGDPAGGLDEILSSALETTLAVVGVDAGEIFLLDQDNGDLILHSQRGLSDKFLVEEATVGRGECLCGLAAQAKQPVIAPDISSHPGRSRPACLREGFRSLLCLPLLAHGQVLGLLNVQSRRRRQFTKQDEELLTAIGNQIGIAIVNARLIKDAEQRRATLDSVMNSLVDGLILVDQRGKIAYANPCAAEMLALPAHAPVGWAVETLESHLASTVSDGDSMPGPPALERISALLRTPTADLVDAPAAEIAVQVPSGERPERCILQVRVFPIHDNNGADLGLGLLLRDITQEKELDQMKSQLLSTVSHELRTPLASIKGFATTLLRRDVDWDETTKREFLAIIDEESDRLSELISNLLDMSRIEAGTLRVEPEAMDLQPLIQEMVDEYQVLTHEHLFEAKLPQALPKVWGDPRRVRQVLRNLVENAVKYSPGGGRITISTQRCRGRDSAPKEEVQVSVSDRGLGIQPEHLQHLFDRFYQVDSTASPQAGGLGLGLSICKAIIKAHKGRIWAESQPGVGSVFHFTLLTEEVNNVD